MLDLYRIASFIQRDNLTAYVLWLREDLQLAATCQKIRTNLLATLTNPAYFSTHLTDYLLRRDKRLQNKDYPIYSDDPTQVVALKKILNSLLHLENTLTTVEKLDVNNQQNSISFYVKAIQSLYKAGQDAYSALELINHCNLEVQQLLVPYLTSLLPKLGLVTERLKQFAPSSQTIATTSGSTFAKAIEFLPLGADSPSEAAGILSDLFVNLPTLFQQLTYYISNQTNQSLPRDEAHEHAMRKQAQATQEDLEIILTNNQLFSLVPSGLSLATTLISFSSDLINTSAPLTLTTYETAYAKLNTIKYQLLPQAIAELEQLAETLGLAPSVVNVVIQHMESWYVGAAQQVNRLATTFNLIHATGKEASTVKGQIVRSLAGDSNPIQVSGKATHIPPKLLTLQNDPRFVAIRKEHQHKRQAQAESESLQAEAALEAAQQFFTNLNDINQRYNARNYFGLWGYNHLSQISLEEQTQLARDYKRFQTYFAKLYPKLDQLVVMGLTPSAQAQWSDKDQTVYNELSFNYDFSEKSHFKQIAACKDSVLVMIGQTIAQTKLKIKLVKDTISQTKTMTGSAPASEPVITPVQDDNNGPLTFAPPSAEPTVLKQLETLQLSAKLRRFLNETLLTYLKQNLSPAIWNQLVEGEEPFDISQLSLKTRLTDSQELLMYKQLLKCFVSLINTLQKLESMAAHESSLSYETNNSWTASLSAAYHTVSRGSYLYTAFYALVLDLSAARQALRKVRANPALSALVQQNLKILEPLQQIPFLGSYLQYILSFGETITTSEQPVTNLYQEWEKQQKILRAQLKSKSRTTTHATPAPKRTEPIKEKPQAESLAATYTETLVKTIYQLADYINSLESTEKTKPTHDKSNPTIDKNAQNLGVLVASFTYNDPSYLQIALRNLVELQIKTAGMGKQGHAFFIKHLSEFRGLVGRDLFLAADNTELQLGLTPGSLSIAVEKLFNGLYAPLITKLPPNIQALLSFDTFSLTEKRLEQTEVELKATKACQAASQAETLIFTQSEITLLDLYREFQATQQAKGNYFAEKQNRKKLIELIEKLHPYLVKIDSNYASTGWFLRTLRTSKDFEKELTKLVHFDKQFQGIVQGLRAENLLKQQMLNVRLIYLQDKLDREKQDAQIKINDFKEKTFSEYLKKYAIQSFAHELGVFAADFFAEVAAEYQTSEKEVCLAAIEIKPELQLEATFYPAVAAVLNKTQLSEKSLASKQFYSTLNAALMKIEHSLEQALQEKDEANPWHKVRIDFLQAKQAELMRIGKEKTELRVDFAQEDANYEMAIKLHDLLTKMQNHLLDEQPERQPSLQHIQTLLNTLNPAKPLEAPPLGVRLASMKQYTVYYAPQLQVLETDDIFEQLINLILALFGLKTKEQHMFDSLHQNLLQYSQQQKWPSSYAKTTSPTVAAEPPPSAMCDDKEPIILVMPYEDKEPFDDMKDSGPAILSF